MKKTTTIITLASVLGIIGILPGGRARAEEIDRVLAAVNGRVITAGDLRLARNLNALVMYGKAQGSAASRQGELDRLVNLELIRGELENAPIEPEEESAIDARLGELSRGYAEVGGLPLLLQWLGMTSEELRTYIALQASILRFVQLRFRPFAGVSPEEIEAYYRHDLLPELKAAGSPTPPLREVAPQIKEILTEKKVDAALDRWIADLRGHSRIEFFIDTPATDDPPASQSSAAGPAPAASEPRCSQ